MSTPPSLTLPDVSVIRVEHGRAVPPECSQLARSRDFRDAGQARPTVSLGCATYTNLAAMIARPEDLTQPALYSGADAELSASAVRRYETEKLAPLPTNETTNVNK
jgi:type IV pilus biogenesis protein CpaD/CtpE